MQRMRRRRPVVLAVHSRVVSIFGANVGDDETNETEAFGRAGGEGRGGEAADLLLLDARVGVPEPDGADAVFVVFEGWAAEDARGDEGFDAEAERGGTEWVVY